MLEIPQYPLYKITKIRHPRSQIMVVIFVKSNFDYFLKENYEQKFMTWWFSGQFDIKNFIEKYLEFRKKFYTGENSKK